MTLNPTPATLHVRGLPADMPTIITPDLKMTRIVIEDGLSVCAPVLLTGRVGYGKTFSVHTVLQEIGVEYVTYKSDHLPRGKALAQALLELLGVAFTNGDRAQDLMKMLKARCATSTVVVIDEAQNLGTEGMRTLRNLSDAAGVTVTLILVGYPGLASHLRRREPALEDRIARRHEFRGIEDDELATTVGAYHSLFANTPLARLQEINNSFGSSKKGSWRRWARVLEVALQYAPDHGNPVYITDALWDDIQALL